MSELKKGAEGTSLPLNLPLVAGIRYVGDQDVYELAEQYYKDGNPLLFTAVFSQLEQDTRKEYLDKAYSEGNTAFFAASVHKLMPDDAILDAYAQKAYKEDSVSFFSILTGYMDEERLQYWTGRAGADKKTSFLYVCLEAADSAY